MARQQPMRALRTCATSSRRVCAALHLAALPAGLLLAGGSADLIARRRQQPLAGVHFGGLQVGQHPSPLLRRGCQPGQQGAKVAGKLRHHAVRHEGRGRLLRAAGGGPGGVAAAPSFLLAQHLVTDHGRP
jgi:hypothetical protein